MKISQKYNSFFFLFCLAHLLFQINFGESDYSERIGVFEIDSEKKIYLLKYYFMNLLRIEFLLLFIISLTIYLYLNKSFRI